MKLLLFFALPIVAKGFAPLQMHPRCSTTTHLVTHQRRHEPSFASVSSSLLSTTSWSSSSSSSINSDDATTELNGETIRHADAVICGGGPAGLLTAIMLAQKYPQRRVRLFDRLAAPPSPDDAAVWDEVAKFYLIGLGGRGQSALRKFGVWDAVRRRCLAVPGRMDWAPDSDGSSDGVERIFDPKEKVWAQVLPRDKLVGVLHEHILANYASQIQLNYGYEVHPVNFDYESGGKSSSSPRVLIRVAKCSQDIARLNPSAVKTATEEPIDVLCDTDSALAITTDLLIAADGTVRTVANAIEAADKERLADMKYNPLARLVAGRPFRVKRYVDDNQRVYKTIPYRAPAEWRPDLNYSARTKDGGVTFDALPANKKGDYCGVLLLKKGHPLAKADTDPAELRQLMDDVLPQFSALLDDETIETVAKKPVSYLPGFRYAGPRLRQGDRCLILGDSAHTVKPYFGLGANSALEDVLILSDILDETNDDLTAAVHTYSKWQAPQAKALVKMSRALDRPGTAGFVSFVLPIILDSIFHKQFPKLFKPNVIAMLQQPAYSFRQVARRKRFDRLAQVGIIGGVLYGAAWATKRSVQLMASLVGKSTSFVSISLVLGAAVAILLKQFASKYFVAGLAPGDVVTRTENKSKTPEPVKQ